MCEISRIENLSAGYKKVIIKDVNISLHEGEIAGIAGPNGQGKTTLLRAIAGGAKRFSGEIYVKNKNCTDMKPKKRAEYISYLPQKIYVPEGISVYDMLSMGLYPYSRIFSVLSKKEKETIEKYAEKINIKDILYSDFSRLSSGQQQLTLLCRMLIQNTPLKLFDEPDSSLDFNNKKMLFTKMHELIKKEKSAGLFVLHDPESALSFCDRIFLTDKGKIISVIDVKNDSREEIENKMKKIYPLIRIEKNPYKEGYICY